MSENIGRIARSSGRRTQMSDAQRKRRKAVQIITGAALIAVIIVMAFVANQTNPKGAYIVIIGTLLGYALQRSRFCFTAALRDPFLTGGTNLTKAMIITFALYSFLLMAINITKFGISLDSVDFSKAAGYIRPVGFHTALGAFLFGIGAVIAGGCASGTFMRMGEGFLQQWVVVIFFIIGSMIGGVAAPIVQFKSAPVVFLPQLFGGWALAAFVQFSLLLILYIVADIWGRKKAGGR
ncbi:MAG TPA: YeeE/YedE thiosulfate transporter family protein [Spirochaetota bacterium]|nr:YeeE/YedE thiosulfate transporter family protein [Spirochaetota bacterium]